MIQNPLLKKCNTEVDKEEAAGGAKAYHQIEASRVGEQPAATLSTFSQAEEDWTTENQQAELTGSIWAAVAPHCQRKLQ